ncbi:MAG: hypothetical protein GY861_25090 [bacterium]|nr:hypothetical protein [bacterium]
MIKHKKKYARSLLTWTAMLATVPLSLYYVGFWRLFVTISWVGFVIGIISILGIINNIINAVKSDEYLEKSSESDRNAYLQQYVSKATLMTVAKKFPDYIEYQKEQASIDNLFFIVIIVGLIFTGHIGISLLWIVKSLSHSLIIWVIDGWDDAVLEEI